jgi:pyruvate formate lyase activating enzyme
VRWRVIASGALFALTVFFSGFLVLSPSAHILKKFPPDTDPKCIREAMYYRVTCNGVQCLLCPFKCFLPEGQRGICNVRINWGGKLYSMVYSQPGAVHVDPIEKKPVFHMLPGTRAFSIATAGCNLRCQFCQNWDIAQSFPETVRSRLMTPEDVVQAAIETGCSSIAYTYSEPVVFYEYMLDTAKLAKAKGLKNIVVTGGFISPEPLHELAQYIDIFKVDLKGFNDRFYRKVCGAPLKYVLETLVQLGQEGKLVEIVNLVVPTLNDNPAEISKMSEWVRENLGVDTPVFFSRFHPDYRLTNLPPTPVTTLEEARSIALSGGLHYVYLGNVPGHEGENTYCPDCGRVVIRRFGFAVLENNIPNGKCKFCGREIAGIWK